MDQIATAMGNVHTTTDQFVTAAQQSEQAAVNLNRLAEELGELTAHYVV